MGKGKYETTVFDRARDELFSHIQRCGVLEADDEHRSEWLKDTTDYLRERYPELNRGQLDELTEIGDRYCRPAIRHVQADEEIAEESADESGTEAEIESGTEAEIESSTEAEIESSTEAEIESSTEAEIDSSGSEAGEEKEVSVA